MLQDFLPAGIEELGSLVVLAFIMWQVLRTIFGYFAKNEAGNQAEKGGLYKLLMELVGSLMTVINRNTEVLNDIKVFLATEAVRKSDIKQIELLINARADMLEALIRSAHPEMNLDDTQQFPVIPEKELDSNGQNE